MSQHDFDLATADANTGPTVRAGMNAMAQALATCSSGATEPSTMYAYQFWADTTSGYMKQRNAANNAWLTRWQLSAGQLAALSGATFTGLVNLAAGANIASATTIDLTAATGNCPRITGTTATSAVTMNTGQWELVVADGAWPLTYHATTNKLNTGGSYTCTAGDIILYYKDLSGIVHGIIFKDGSWSKSLSFTRDLTAASGDVSYTGFGFTPTTILVNAVKSGSLLVSMGSGTGTDERCLFFYDSQWNTSTNSIAYLVEAGGVAAQQAVVKSSSHGEVTLTWIKTGSPTGTATLHITAFA